MSKKRFIYFIILLLLCARGVAQEYQSLLHKPYAERVVAINQLYGNILALSDSAIILNKAQQIKNFAAENNDKELAMEIDLFSMYYFTEFQKQKEIPEKTILRIKKVITDADKAGIRHIKIRGMRVLADFYWRNMKNFELAFEQYLLIDKELNETSETDYPDMARDLLFIGNAYYFFQEIDVAKTHLTKTARIKETAFNTGAVASAKNTLALCYRKMGDLTKAEYYFNEVLKTPFDKTRKEWDGIIKGNLGTNHYIKKEYDAAIPLMQYSWQQAERYEDYQAAAGSQIMLADIYIIKNDLKTAWSYIDLVRKNIERALNKEEEDVKDKKRLLLPILSKWYAANKQVELSRMYFDSTLKANEEYNERFNSIKILRAQQKIIAKEQELKLTELSLAEHEKSAQRNLLLIALTALITIVFAGYRTVRRKQQIKDIKLAAANHELKEAAENLNRFTQSITEKNLLIEQLQSNQSEEDKSNLISQLQKSTILTDDDWKSFQDVFDKVYPGFITRLKQTYPNLSVGEVRYFVLSKLNLSYREMAAMMGVSPNTVQVMRHRIRKKMGFEDNEAMEQAILTV